MHLKRGARCSGSQPGTCRPSAELKLGQAGLLDLFDFGGWSDAHENRSDVFRAAAGKGTRSLAGRCRSSASSAIRRPTSRRAATIGFAVIAVATGIYSLEQLQAESSGASACTRLKNVAGVNGVDASATQLSRNDLFELLGAVRRTCARPGCALARAAPSRVRSLSRHGAREYLRTSSASRGSRISSPGVRNSSSPGQLSERIAAPQAELQTDRTEGE